MQGHAEVGRRRWAVRVQAALVADALLRSAVLAGLVLGVLFWTRRLVGAFATPLSAPALLVVGLVAAAWSAAARQAGPRHAWAWACPLAALLAAAVWLPGTSSLGALVLLAPLAVQEAVVRWRLGRSEKARREAQPNCDAEESPFDNPPEPPPSDVTQQLTRRRTADGLEQLHGWLRACFAPGQRWATVHVAFCPPFVQAPACEAEAVEGPAASVAVGQLVPHGARLDVRLDRPATEPCNVLVELIAQPAEP